MLRSSARGLWAKRRSREEAEEEEVAEEAEEWRAEEQGRNREPSLAGAPLFFHSSRWLGRSLLQSLIVRIEYKQWPCMGS